MGIILANIPQVEFDEYEMSAREWLELAKHEHKPPYNTVHGNYSANGFVMHVTESESECKCGEQNIHEKYSELFKKSIPETNVVIHLRRQFLLDALIGINPDDDEIEIRVASESGAHPVVIRSRDRTAIIMPLSVKEF